MQRPGTKAGPNCAASRLKLWRRRLSSRRGCRRRRRRIRSLLRCVAQWRIASALRLAFGLLLIAGADLIPGCGGLLFLLGCCAPARPNGPACVWRWATSAASGAAGVSGSSCGPFGFGSLGSLLAPIAVPRSLFLSYGVVSNGLSGSAFAATCGGNAPASSV